MKPNKRDADGNTPAHHYVNNLLTLPKEHFSSKIEQQFFNITHDLNITDSSKNTPVHLFVRNFDVQQMKDRKEVHYRFLEFIDYAMKHKYKFEMHDGRGYSAFHSAATKKKQWQFSRCNPNHFRCSK